MSVDQKENKVVSKPKRIIIKENEEGSLHTRQLLITVFI